MNEFSPCYVDLSFFSFNPLNYSRFQQPSIQYYQKYSIEKMNDLILFPFSKSDCIEWFWAIVTQKLLRTISVVQRTNLPSKTSFIFHPKLFLVVFGMEKFNKNIFEQNFDTESLRKMIPQSHFRRKKKSQAAQSNGHQ
jgi:hypothetical protein